jgi:general secretion pathway protein M
MKFKFAFSRPKLPKLPKLPALPKLTPEQRARLEPYVARWRALPVQQRRLAVFGGALLAAAMLYALLWSPMQNELARLRDTTPKERSKLAVMQAQAQEVAELRASGKTMAGRGGNILSTLEQLATARGLRSNITRMEPEGANGAQVTLEAAHFNGLLTLLHELQTQNGVRIENASLEAHATVGHVNARLTLRGPTG